MTEPGTAPGNGDDDLTPRERRAVARRLYLESVAAGNPMTGDELAQHLGVTDRWGRKLITRFKEEAEQPRANGHRPAGANRSREQTIQSREVEVENRDDLLEAGDIAPPSDPARPSSDSGRDPQPDAPDAHPAGRGSWLDAAITLVVALVAAAASYGHMLHVAMLAGEPLWIARAFPVTVDGLVLAAIRRGKDGRGWLALGAAVSVAANVLAQFPEHATAVGPVVSAWPPIALYGTHRLLQASPVDPPSSGGDQVVELRG